MRHPRLTVRPRVIGYARIHMNVRRRHRAGGFTRTDLMSLVATGTLLLALLIAGTGMTRARTGSTQCLASLGQMVRAWQMYAVESQESMVYNMGVAETLSEVNAGTYRNWVHNTMSWVAGGSQDARSNTNQILAVRGGIGPYLEAGWTAYHCPSDRYLSPVQRQAGWPSRVRSRSMNAFLGPYSPTANDPSWTGRNTFENNYRQFLRLSEIPQPARTFVFLDEHPDSINDGYYLNTAQASSWGDIPGSLHDGAGAFGFADGHAEIHLWESKASKPAIRFVYTSSPFDAAGRRDFTWYKEHTPFEPVR